MAQLQPLNLVDYLMRHPLSGQIVLDALKKNPIYGIPGFLAYLNDYMRDTKDASSTRIIRWRTYTLDGLEKIGYPDPTSDKLLEMNKISVNDLQATIYMRSYGLELDDMTFEYEATNIERSRLISSLLDFGVNQVNNIATATMNNLASLEGEFLFGDGVKKFERPFIEKSIHDQLKGHQADPINRVIGICLNYATLTKILSDQDANPAKPKLIDYVEYHNYGNLGLETAITRPVYYYKIGMIPVYVWEGLLDNHVFFVRGESLGVAVGPFSKLKVVDDPRIGDGSGKHQYMTRQQYQVHPMGTTFIGKEGTHYTNYYSGPKEAELNQTDKPFYSTFSSNVQQFLPRITIFKIPA